MGRNKVPPKKTLTRKQNPGVRGRPAGSKNKSTILQEAIKGNFERSLKRNFQDVMGALIREAKDGNIAAIKLLMDKVIPNAQVEGEMKTGEIEVAAVEKTHEVTGVTVATFARRRTRRRSYTASDHCLRSDS